MDSKELFEFLISEAEHPFSGWDRHESYSPNEVYRILKPGGLFITQQVSDKNDWKLRFILIGSEKLVDDIKWNLDYAINQLESLDFKIIESYENITLIRIYEVGAIVYYLKAIPWEVPNFSIKKYYNKLIEIHNEINHLLYYFFILIYLNN